MKTTLIKDLKAGYYFARHNGVGKEHLAQNTGWRPVEVMIMKKDTPKQKKGTILVCEFLCGPFDVDCFEFGERIKSWEETNEV